jgi:plasmid maintenance system killer protein
MKQIVRKVIQEDAPQDREELTRLAIARYKTLQNDREQIMSGTTNDQE